MSERPKLVMTTRTEIEERGFAVLGGIFSPAEMQQLIIDLSRSGLKRSKAGVRRAMSHQEIACLAVEARLLSVAQEILGREARPPRNTIRLAAAQLASDSVS